MSQALYRKYRSKSLAEVVGQSHITDVLSRALSTGKVAHAYLLTGPRGVGKTSIARILAHEINKLPYDDETTHLDIIEIDAASNNGVEDVRDLREKVQLAPVSADKKVYIIDEVHMLSKPAFNALLKTLEEPPAHVVFILATTDIEKLPATIVSRTQRYGFRAIDKADAVKHLRFIADEEKISINDEALELIAKRGDGSFRDSISLLDQLSSLAPTGTTITATLIEESLGLAPRDAVESLIAAVSKHDVASVAKQLQALEADGISPTVITQQLIDVLRDSIIDHPHHLLLLDSLLDVPKSANPSMKLLAVLGTAAHDHKPKTAALAAPVLEVSATIEELSQQATKPHPVEPVSKPKAAESEKPKTVAEKPVEPTPVIADAPAVAAPAADFDWSIMMLAIKDRNMAMYSVLGKCAYELEDSQLTIYCLNAFYKKKLDDPRYSSHMYEALQTSGFYGLTVETVPTGAPMKSSQAEAIAAIMGGGTEVLPEAAPEPAA